MEQPVRCVITCSAQGNKNLSSNAKGMVFATQIVSENEEFTLTPQSDDTILLRSTKHNRFLCSNANGSVYASETRHGGMEKWTLTRSRRHGGGLFYISSACSNRKLSCGVAGAIRTIMPDEDDEHGQASKTCWSIEFSSGELCFLSSPHIDMRLRCDLAGNLSMSKNYKGWEAWRLSEAGNGYVRISPWAHSEKFLCSNDKGDVYTTENREGGESEKWSVEKAPPILGLVPGVVIKSAKHGRILRYNESRLSLHTVTYNTEQLEDSCIWQFESLHRQLYHLVSVDSNKRIGATKDGSVCVSRFPIRNRGEEWQLQQVTGERGVVSLFSHARQSYLRSSASGDVLLTTSPPRENDSAKWIIEEQEGGNVLVSQVHERVLTCAENGSLITIRPKETSTGMFWKLEPKVPRQVTKEKMKAVGLAVTIGVATTLATPIVLGGAIGLIGITEVGAAGHAVIGSIRAAEALSTIGRVTDSSSQLLRSESSVLSCDGKTIDSKDSEIGNRPFCAWSSW